MIRAVALLAMTVAVSAAQRAEPPLPFGIAPAQLAETEIRLRIASTKINSGFDEIVIRGDGAVVLRTAAFANEPPKELAGTAGAAAVERLLRLLRAEGIENWDAERRAKTAHYVSRVLTVTVNGETKKEVVVSGAEFPEFARACGAIKLVAGLARVEALNGKFFQRF